MSVIVPTLNEAEHIGQLLRSLHGQSMENFEVIVVDGGSQDGTANIASSQGARVLVLEGAKEFEARNYAALNSRAPILVFSCADVMFPPASLASISRRFRNDSHLTALTGPDVPYDGGFGLRMIYGFYNAMRYVFSKLPYPLKTFSSSTNFLVVDKKAFGESGGFRTDDVNADGLMGRYLADTYGTLFDNTVMVYISGRRALQWGIRRFARHYLYVLENFFPMISGNEFFAKLKSDSRKNHGKIHERKF